MIMLWQMLESLPLDLMVNLSNMYGNHVTMVTMLSHLFYVHVAMVTMLSVFYIVSTTSQNTMCVCAVDLK